MSSTVRRVENQEIEKLQEAREMVESVKTKLTTHKQKVVQNKIAEKIARCLNGTLGQIVQDLWTIVKEPGLGESWKWRNSVDPVRKQRTPKLVALISVRSNANGNGGSGQSVQKHVESRSVQEGSRLM